MALYENPNRKAAISVFITILILGIAFTAGVSANVITLGNKPEPVTEKIFEPVPAYGTLNPEVFRQYIKKVNPKAYDRLADEIVDAIYQNGRKYRISPILVAALMHTESEFNPFAVSKTGAVSLMQVQPNIWEETLIKNKIIADSRDLYDPFKAVASGCFILREFTDDTKDFSQALNKYLGDDHKPYRDAIAKHVGEIMVEAITKEIDAAYSLK